MRIAIFGGSFDPVHAEHVRLARTAVEKLSLDKLIVMPSYLAPHKLKGATADGAERLELCRIAFSQVPRVEVDDFELKRGGVSYTFVTCRAFAERYPNARRFFLVGADMLENFYFWREPEEILRCVRLVACGRGGALPTDSHSRFVRRFHTDFCELEFIGKPISSTELRVRLCFQKQAEGLDANVFNQIREKGLYRLPHLDEALALEEPERREHSYRTARLACERAAQRNIPENKALLAAAFHDCGKSVALSSPLLKAFRPPEDVPAPVLHQYVGAYLAQTFFGIEDEDALNAIRYHTSGRAGMSELEKLIYLADLLEPARNYPGVEELRSLFETDMDACLLRALKEQIAYLKASGKPVFSLTEQAYEWISRSQNEKN